MRSNVTRQPLGLNHAHRVKLDLHSSYCKRVWLVAVAILTNASHTCLHLHGYQTKQPLGLRHAVRANAYICSHWCKLVWSVVLAVQRTACHICAHMRGSLNEQPLGLGLLTGFRLVLYKACGLCPVKRRAHSLVPAHRVLGLRPWPGETSGAFKTNACLSCLWAVDE